MPRKRQEHIIRREGIPGYARYAWRDAPCLNHCAPVAFAHAANLGVRDLQTLIKEALAADLLNGNGDGAATFEGWADLASRIGKRRVTFTRRLTGTERLDSFLSRESRGVWILAGNSQGLPPFLFGEDHVLTVIDGVPWGYIPPSFVISEARQVKLVAKEATT